MYVKLEEIWSAPLIIELRLNCPVRSKTNYQYTGSCKILCTATVRVLFDAESVQAPLLQMQINLQYTTRTRSQANVNLGGRFAWD